MKTLIEFFVWIGDSVLSLFKPRVRVKSKSKKDAVETEMNSEAIALVQANEDERFLTTALLMAASAFNKIKEGRILIDKRAVERYLRSRFPGTEYVVWNDELARYKDIMIYDLAFEKLEEMMDAHPDKNPTRMG